jgi:LPXTG-motif cell wall-anchored protein
MKESYLTERDKQLSKPVIVGSIFITVILARIAFNLLKAAAEERSAWPLVVALAILGALSGFWIWKKKKASR